MNQRYEFYTALRAIFAAEPIRTAETGSKNADGVNDQHIAIINEIPSVRLALFSGVLVKGSMSPVDILLVGTLPAAKVKAAMAMIEKLEGREINYTVLSYDEFYYRLSVRDRFITEVLAGKHSVAVDKDNVLSGE